MHKMEPNPRQILVIDDDTLCARAVCNMLEREGGITATHAPSCGAAMTHIDSQTVDLILCDLHMPGCDGVETMRLLADRGITCPIVLVSGTDPRLLATAAQMGASRGLNMIGTLHKPFGATQLKDCLRDTGPITQPRAERLGVLTDPAELQRAIENDELLLHYQPQLRLMDRKLEGVEALVRWEHPERGLIFPDAFIPTAEESGLIEPMTDWVVQKALSQAAEWQRTGMCPGMSINVSARSLHRLDLPDRVEEASRAVQLEPERVTLEVTESGVSEDMGAMLDIVTRLRLKGFALSIDDFGTGFSSLAQLRRLPFTELKLDRSFVRGAAMDADALSVLESSINLAKRLRLKTVAEGIESRAEWDLLVALGVDLGQGYHMARPMPASQLPDWHSVWQNGGGTISQIPEPMVGLGH